MAKRQPGRRPSALRVDLVGATAEQIAACLLDVDPVKAGQVAFILGERLAHDDGPIGLAFAAADADPLGFLGRLAGAAVNHAAAHNRAAPPALIWSYEDPEV